VKSKLLLSTKRISFGLVLFLFVGVLALAGWFLQFTGNVAEGDKTQSVAVIIAKGSTIQEINSLLAEKNLVEKDIRFLLLARYLGIATRLQAGEFALHRGQTPEELLLELSNAKPIQHPVTIPEGLVINDIAAIFAAGGWCDQDTYIRLAHDADFLNRLGLGEHDNLEGYLYPDTYYLTRQGHDAADLIRMQVRRYFSVWHEVAEGKQTELSPFEVLILASMVEKEVGVAVERPIIAGVFLNRLQKGMRLQSDPTVMYGIENFSGPLTKTNLRTPTPYNTYTLKRLPAGPICNPGKEALHAVLVPEKTDFLYFVSKGKRRHHFSKTLREHNRAVYKYLRAPKR
jgi:peptidoglycan lytic transglycosylase G